MKLTHRQMMIKIMMVITIMMTMSVKVRLAAFSLDISLIKVRKTSASLCSDVTKTISCQLMKK